MKRLIVYFILIVNSITLKAQTELRLSDAINIAMKNSLDIQLANNSIEANTILNNYGVAGGLPLVTSNLSDNEQVSNINQKLNSGENISRTGAATNNLVAGLAGSILLYNGNRV